MAAAGGGNAQAMREVWTKTVDRVKREVIAPQLWRALEHTVAVAWEQGTFAVGISPAAGQLSGQLNTGEYRHAIEKTLQAVTGDGALAFRVIEGTTYADWEYTKQRDAAAAAQRQATAQRRYTESETFASWDEIYDQTSRLWANSEYRSIASGRGRFLESALALVEKAMDALYPKDGTTNEQTERGLSRVIERIASITNSDPTVIAYLLIQRRKGAGE